MVSLDTDGSKLRCWGGKQGNKLSFELELLWSVEIKDLILVAEYTTNEGPHFDDYFLIFQTKTCAFECTFYAEGRDAAFVKLSEQLNIPLQLQLCNSTDWKSRVIWPIHLAGTDYFQFTPVKPISLVSSICKAVFGPQLEYRVAEPIRKYIQEA
jgi:hypothetical protein